LQKVSQIKKIAIKRIETDLIHEELKYDEIEKKL
jgi:hypothetical protein